uniref:Beta-galactosidase n=1 Tax=Heligmosomoides polygyrus TaxID=6339 RepID=A0A183FJL0_HELPZ
LMFLNYASMLSSDLLRTCVIMCACSGSPSFSVDYEHDQFLLDGKPFRYISGSIHYFRIHPSQWKDRLQRVRALGFNAIQYYIPWNFHEIYEGQYDFSGGRNFTEFSRIASELGMYSLLRLGPYVCGEWENGGLPWWLLNKNISMMRTSEQGFKTAVKKWFSVLLPLVQPLLRKNGGPVLMVQVENEYGSYKACDRNYTTWLRDEAKTYFGDDTVIYTTDGNAMSLLKCGSIPDTLTTVDFGPTTDQKVNASFELQRKFFPNGHGPLVNSEFYPGWLVLWGEKTASVPSPDDIVRSAKHMYSLGANINFYMIHGGTNFGFWNGAETNAPVITSYDYFAPISEAGDVTPKYLAIRAWIKSLLDWKTPPLDIRITTEDLGRRPSVPFRCFRWTIFPYLLIGGPGTFVHSYNGKSKKSVDLSGCSPGNILTILVENQGRQTFETINDYKGILSEVEMDKSELINWMQCIEDLIYVKLLWADARIQWTSSGKYGVYRGVFHVDVPTDTFLNTSAWGKGVAIVNGNNLGRYWASEGPQYTLYVPAAFLRSGDNELVVLELEGTKNCGSSSCTMSFVDQPIYTWNTTTSKGDFSAGPRRHNFF